MTETTQTVEEVEELAVDAPPPFLRITGTYPVGQDRFESVALELNLHDDDPAIDYEPDAEAGAAVKSWITDFATQVIGELRRPPAPSVIRLDGAAKAFLVGRAKHADDCTGDCGVPATAEPGGRKLPADRETWSFGDRQDS